MKPIVIIGTGLAGYNLAKEFRKLDKERPLRIFTADNGDSYSKPLLSNALAKGKTAEQLVIASAEKMALQLNAVIDTHARVASIDATAKTIVVGDQVIEYHQLVLATGASQILLPIAGTGAEDIFSVNDLQQYGQFRAALENAQSIAIIGPGLIGCEFANDMVAVGKKATVIGPGETPLERLLPPEAGLLLQQVLASKGVEWRLGVTAASVDKAPAGYQLVLSDGSELQVDLVLSSIGLRPNIELAELAGADTNRGIVVDRYLQSSLPDIYALGDCIEIAGLVLPFVLPLVNGARTLAKTLSGTPTQVSYPAMPVVIKTPAHPIVISPPASDAQGQWQLDVEQSGVRAHFRDAQNALLGFALTGDKVSEKQALTRELPPVLQ